MDLPYSIRVRVRNKRRHAIQVGNRLVQGKSYDWVELSTREAVVRILLLEKNKQIRIITDIPKEILMIIDGTMSDEQVAPVSPVTPYVITSPTPAPTTDTATGPVDYRDLLNKPVIPTKVSQLTNDSNYVRKENTFSGDYAHLTNKPLIPSKTSELQHDSKWLQSESIGTIEVVTQAEYDALPDTKYTDNVLYLLKGDA